MKFAVDEESGYPGAAQVMSPKSPKSNRSKDGKDSKESSVDGKKEPEAKTEPKPTKVEPGTPPSYD